MSPERMGGEGAVFAAELERADKVGALARAVILVEGTSDQRAVAALAKRQGRDLDSEGVAIIPTAGATNFRMFLEMLGPGGHDVILAGLCDRAERAALSEALRDVGLMSDGVDIESLGFFVCNEDLEDELIRALGADQLVRLIESHGHIRRFRSFQNQPAQRHKTVEQQLWRWLGNFKIRYAPLMVEALDLDQVPHPLEAVLDKV